MRHDFVCLCSEVLYDNDSENFFNDCLISYFWYDDDCVAMKIKFDLNITKITHNYLF